MLQIQLKPPVKTGLKIYNLPFSDDESIVS